MRNRINEIEKNAVRDSTSQFGKEMSWQTCGKTNDKNETGNIWNKKKEYNSSIANAK